MKILFTVFDGLSERPLRELENKTPLEAAFTPNLDILAKFGVSGLMDPVFRGALPTSEEGHLALFGYDVRSYQIRRGFFTAQGAGIVLKPGDVALRGNFCIVDKDLNILDRRAGRIKKPQPLIEALQGIEIEGVKFIIRSAGEHRLGIVMRPSPSFKIFSGKKNLSSNISDSDPLYWTLENKVKEVKPLEKTREAIFTARVLNKFLERAAQILKKMNLGPNYIIVRGASSLHYLPSFKEKYSLEGCCIAGKLLYKQIAKTLGMELIEVPGATGLPNTNLKGKFLAASKILKEENPQKSYDFVFLHIKGTDSLAEDGQFEKKKEFIEKIDKNLRFVFGHGDFDFEQMVRNKNFVWVITADHSTCSDLCRHCSAPVPILISAQKRDRVKEFSETAFSQGSLGRFSQLEAMRKIFQFA